MKMTILKKPATQSVWRNPSTSTRIPAVTNAPSDAPRTLARYRWLKLFASESRCSRTYAITSGKVAPMAKHHGKTDSAMATAENDR
jgi:hypothetical protein